MTCKPETTAASAALSGGTSTPTLPSARARKAMGRSKLGPSFLTSPSARLMAVRPNVKLEKKPFAFAGGRRLDSKA
jgi:hypothetical protein